MLTKQPLFLHSPVLNLLKFFAAPPNSISHSLRCSKEGATQDMLSLLHCHLPPSTTIRCIWFPHGTNSELHTYTCIYIYILRTDISCNWRSRLKKIGIWYWTQKSLSWESQLSFFNANFWSLRLWKYSWKCVDNFCSQRKSTAELCGQRLKLPEVLASPLCWKKQNKYENMHICIIYRSYIIHLFLACNSGCLGERFY